MRTGPQDGLRLSEKEARRLLVRAGELDGTRSLDVSVQQLRQIAIESGIAPEAFDAALSELSAPASPPAWVRLCMFGVPDRRIATGYYWLFLLLMCVWPFRALLGVPTSPEDAMLATIAGMGFCGFALWSTSRAIRWLDEHGWSLLR